MRFLPKEIESLWTLFTAPVVWALHFLACYLTAAIYCEKFSGEQGFTAIRLWLAAITVAALAAITFSGWLALRQWGYGKIGPPHEEPTREERLRFQGYATLLLSGLSFAAVLFVALPLFFIEACHR